MEAKTATESNIRVYIYKENALRDWVSTIQVKFESQKDKIEKTREI